MIIWTSRHLSHNGKPAVHTLGFDETGNGIFQIEFAGSNVNGLFFTFVYEIVVIAFAVVIFITGKK